MLRCVPERAHELEHRGDARGVVGRAVADVVAGAEVAAGVTEVVVVRADHDVLVGEIGPREACRSILVPPVNTCLYASLPVAAEFAPTVNGVR